MILVSSPASRRSFSIFAASNSGLVPFITSVPSPIGTANIVVAVNTLIARGLPRVPRTIHRHVELFSQIQDIAYVCARRCDRRCQVSGDAFCESQTKDGRDFRSGNEKVEALEKLGTSERKLSNSTARRQGGGDGAEATRGDGGQGEGRTALACDVCGVEGCGAGTRQGFSERVRRAVGTDDGLHAASGALNMNADGIGDEYGQYLVANACCRSIARARASEVRRERRIRRQRDRERFDAPGPANDTSGGAQRRRARTRPDLERDPIPDPRIFPSRPRPGKHIVRRRASRATSLLARVPGDVPDADLCPRRRTRRRVSDSFVEDDAAQEDDDPEDDDDDEELEEEEAYAISQADLEDAFGDVIELTSRTTTTTTTTAGRARRGGAAARARAGAGTENENDAAS